MKHSLRNFLCILCIVTCIGSITGCQSADSVTSVTGYKLNTIVAIDAYSKVSTEILNNALNLCDTYEKMFSRTMEDSILYEVNHQQRTQIPAELASLIQYGITYSELSDGAFDLTIGSVSQLWDFTADEPMVPDQTLIAEALTHVDYTNVVLTRNPSDEAIWNIQLKEGTMIDLGAIAKGYIADRIKDYLLENGVTNAIINLGGNVLCIGGKTRTTDFSIGIKKPFGSSGESLAILNLNDLSAVSSGTYERYFYAEDVFYHHILSPTTGMPYDNGLTDVTIISKESVIGDCLSTTCFALGLEDGLALIENLDGVEALFVTSDGVIHYSSGASAYLK